MLCGSGPFDRNGAQATMSAILREEPPPLLRGRMERLDRIARKALSKPCELRYQNLDDLVIDLREALEELPAKEHPAETPHDGPWRPDGPTATMITDGLGLPRNLLLRRVGAVCTAAILVIVWWLTRY
jgi:hypothetical protein